MPETKTLELVDAALDEGRVTAADTDDRLLQELALMVRDETRPEPSAEFTREMDEFVATGFGRRPDPDAGRGGGFGAWLDSIARALRSPLGLAGTGAVAVLVVVAVVLSSSTGTKDESVSSFQEGGSALEKPSATESQDSAAAPSATSEESGGGGTSAPSPVPPEQKQRSGGTAGEPPRIARQAQLTLETSADDFQSVADQIVQLTDRRRGFVLSSSVSDSDTGGRGDFQLKVPADQLQATLKELSDLANVTARSQTGQDVTQEYVSAADRLEAARAERRSLLRRLAGADDDAQAQRLRDRLDANAREINVLRGQVRGLLEQTNYSTIAVTLNESDKAGDDDNGGAAAGSTSDALDDSFGLLVGSFNWLLRALGVLIPVGIVGGTAWWAGRTLRRRRREAVLF